MLLCKFTSEIIQGTFGVVEGVENTEKEFGIIYFSTSNSFNIKWRHIKKKLWNFTLHFGHQERKAIIVETESSLTYSQIFRLMLYVLPHS